MPTPSSKALMDATKKRAEKLQAKGKAVDFKELLRMEPDGGTDRAQRRRRPRTRYGAMGNAICLVVRKNPRHRRQVANVAVHDAEQRTNGSLVCRDRIKIAHQSGFGSRVARLPR